MLVALDSLVHLVSLVYPVSLVQPNKQDKPNKPEQPEKPDEPDKPRIAFGPDARVFSPQDEIGEGMITPDVLTEYLRRMMPDVAVTVSDRTGTMDHLKVVVISAAFAGKNLLDRHRLIYQALDGPLKDGRIHALELTANTPEEA